MSKKKERDENMVCRTPSGLITVKVESWKYFVVRQAIINAVSRPIRGIFLKELPDYVAKSLGDKAKAIGTLPQVVNAVKMEMEVRGELVRSKKLGKQWLGQGPEFQKGEEY